MSAESQYDFRERGVYLEKIGLHVPIPERLDEGR